MTKDQAKLKGNQRELYEVLSLREEHRVWLGWTVGRFLVIPTAVAVLLATGVYWIHSMPSGGPLNNEEGAQIRVRILEMPRSVALVARMPGNTSAQSRAHSVKIAPTDADLSADPTMASLAPKVDEDEAFAAPSDQQLLPANLSNEPIARFQETLLRRIALFRRYPASAREAKVQGTVEVAFTMRRDGKVLNAWVGTSSGTAVLDQEAIDMVRRAEPLPQVPSELPAPVSIKLPVVFALP
ncbi:MAG: energy transducer TonB [Pseudomonadota bacterium]